MILVWEPKSCSQFEDGIGENEEPIFKVRLTELAHDALLSTDDPKADGPLREQILFAEEPCAFISGTWTYREVVYDNEVDGLAAWVAWVPPT